MEALIVEDDRIIAITQKYLLEKYNFFNPIKVFHEGNEALKYLKTAIQNNSPILVLLDLNMPKVSGFKILEELKTFANPNQVMVYVVTSSVDYDDEQKVYQSNFCRGFVSKPLIEPAVEKIIAKLQSS